MRAFAILAALAMIVSLFLPWVNGGAFGFSATPLDMIRALKPDLGMIGDLLQSAPWEAIAFLATFLLAALFLLLLLFNLPSRLVGFLAGGVGVGLVLGTAWQIRNKTSEFSALGLDFSRPSDTLSQLTQILGIGAWAWGIGALVLLLTTLIGYRR